MTQETINPIDNVDLKRKAEDELAQDSTKIAKPELETNESEATLAAEQVTVPVVTEPAEEAVAEPVEAADAPVQAEVEDLSKEDVDAKDETVEAEVEEVEEEAEEEVEEDVEPTKKTKKSKKDASSDFEDEEDLEEDDAAALDKSNIITTGRRTRGKVIDFKALVASDDEDDEDEE